MSTDARTASTEGARSPGISYQELLDTDTHPVPRVLRLESPPPTGPAEVDIAHYISREWHDLEMERLWPTVWQFACRENDIAEVGDHVVYEIGRFSYVVMRTAPHEIKAYPNACLHRGRRLKDHSGRCSEIRCPFHGFAWTIDGSLAHVPARWDFPELDDDDFSLPECQVGTWAGFVMINPDPGAEPLASYLGAITDHFDAWNLAERYTQAHVAKVIHANWKVAQEAFCEAYHVSATHPQILPYLGDTNSQVDIWENFARVITAGGTPSPLLDWVPTQDEMMRAMTDTRHDEPTPMPVAEGESMRTVGAEASRDRWRPTAGDGVDTMSDAEMMDSIDYTVFPNFHPWGAFNRIVYRFRPNGDDHRSSIMECFFLAPFSGERPTNVPAHFLEEDETFIDAPELGMLGKVFNQDLFNMARVQEGLETTRRPSAILGQYQEGKIRWLHEKLATWVGTES